MTAKRARTPPSPKPTPYPRWPRTLADEPRFMYLWRADRSAPFDASCAWTRVVAPCCGRITPADTILDVRHIGPTIVGAANRCEPRDHGWLCDGCLHLLLADPGNDWTMSKLLEAQGAPIAVVHEHRAREQAHGLARPHRENGTEYEPEQLYVESLAAIATEHREAILDDLKRQKRWSKA